MARLHNESFELTFPRLPSELDGVRILHLSDLHVCAGAAGYLKRVLRAVVQCNADLIVLTGDVVNHERDWPRAVDWLMSLPINSSVPRLAVAGNWDLRAGGGGQCFSRAMRDAGFEPLNNQGMTIPLRGRGMQVAGFDDIRYGTFHPQAALQDLDPDGFLLGLCHNPDIVLYLSPWPFDCMLTGHTHGGQVRLPGARALITSTLIGVPFASGLFPLQEHQWLYVSRGIGTGILPLRWNCPPEFTLVTLRANP